MHLRDDTYSRQRARDAAGRDVFEHSRWRLERLQRERGRSPEQWQNVDLVIEYARARALERSRRYREAHDAYERVAEKGSLLAEPAEGAREVMSRFARHSSRPRLRQAPAAEVAFLNERIQTWRSLAWEYRSTSYGSLAREEAETWESARVEALLRQGDLDAAIRAAHRLIEQHRTSKLYARHLIRLGDLYADRARREFLRSETNARDFDAVRYERYLDRAFAAYELAGEQRRPALRTEASKKIEALLATHQGVQRRAR